MSETNLNYGSQQMRLFFHDFLNQIGSIIYHIKTNVYKLVNIQPILEPKNSTGKITGKLAAILNTCKHTFEDLKRVSLVLEGYVQSKQKKKNSEKNKRNKNKQNFNNFTFQNSPRNSFTFLKSQTHVHSQQQLQSTVNFGNNSDLQKKLAHSIVTSSKTDQLIFNSLSLNSQEDTCQKFIKKHQRKNTQCKNSECQSDRQPTDVQSFGNCFTKRSNFSNLNQISQKRMISIKNSPQKSQQIKQSPQMRQNALKRNLQCLKLIRQIRKQLSR